MALQLAFIGLGTMGFPIAGHLAAAGHELVVNNRTGSRADQWIAKHRGRKAAAPAEAAHDTDIVFICVGNDDDLRSVVCGSQGLLTRLKRGAIIVDHTTTSANVAREIAAAAQEIGVDFLDAPVSGGQPGAEKGQLGIGIERIKPGHPQQNGRHERMHLTLKKEATKPASFNFLQQQSRFDEFIEVYNHQRPHAAIGMRYPGEIYTPSPRPYRDPALPQYPFHDRTVCVTRCGRICIGKRKINLSQVFSGQLVGIREVEEKIWLVSFLDFDLGYFDEKEGRVEPGPNPFEATVLTMSSA
jgi:transposase InsO family protein